MACGNLQVYLLGLGTCGSQQCMFVKTFDFFIRFSFNLSRGEILIGTDSCGVNFVVHFQFMLFASFSFFNFDQNDTCAVDH